MSFNEKKQKSQSLHNKSHSAFAHDSTRRFKKENSTAPSFSGKKSSRFPKDEGHFAKQQGRDVKPVAFADIFYGLNKIQADPSMRNLSYKDCLACKEKALQLFWDRNRLSGKPRHIIPSPKERHYRTTSKRKVSFDRGGLKFSLGYNLKGSSALSVDTGTMLEAELHGKIYDYCFQNLQKAPYLPLARVINFLIVRGSYTKAALVFNLFQLSGTIVHKLKDFATEIMSAIPEITGVHLFYDETRSDYYFEATHPRGTEITFKKIAGESLLDLQLPNRPKLLYPPNVFSQVNESILPVFTDKILESADLNAKTRFLDLYCGYGLFGLYAAEKVKSVVGIDMEGPSIHAAIANAQHLYPNKELRFFPSAITEKSVCELLPSDPNDEEVILLDPPRNGTEGGVIPEIAVRRCKKIIAIYCSVEQMAKELPQWLKCNLKVESIQPFDLFPYSPNLETAITFTK